MKRRTSRRLAIAFLLWPIIAALAIIIPFYTIYFWLGEQALVRIWAKQAVPLTIFGRTAFIIEFCLWCGAAHFAFNWVAYHAERQFPWFIEPARKTVVSMLLWDELKERRKI